MIPRYSPRPSIRVSTSRFEIGFIVFPDGQVRGLLGRLALAGALIFAVSNPIPNKSVAFDTFLTFESAATVALICCSLVQRYRTSTAIQTRLQMRWIFLGFAMFSVCIMANYIFFWLWESD